MVSERTWLIKDKNYYKNRCEELQQENKKFEKQLEYIRSSEYYNQLRFERDMLQNIVDTGEVSKEDKEFIDCTHRNTELVEENQKYKEVIDKLKEKCKTKRGKYDFDVWVKLNENWKILDGFVKSIRYNLHPIITDAYCSDIKNSINELLKTTRYDVLLKEDILDILKEVE